MSYDELLRQLEQLKHITSHEARMVKGMLTPVALVNLLKGKGVLPANAHGVNTPAEIHASVILNDRNRNSKLFASTPGNQSRTSREISLGNRNRDLRL